MRMTAFSIRYQEGEERKYQEPIQWSHYFKPPCLINFNQVAHQLLINLNAMYYLKMQLEK